MRPWSIVLAIVLALLAWQWPETTSERNGLALLVLIGTLWITEAIPLTFTALLVPVLGVALGLAGVPEALSGFAHPVIALFLGGFALAAALSAQGIDRWIANRVLVLSGGRPLPAALLLSGATAVLSMWISNTATTAMMLPIALGLAGSAPGHFPRYRVFLLLGLAWGANVGGIATLIGSPPNAITAAALDWGFNDWLRVGLPVSVLLFPLALGTLYFSVRPEPDVPRMDPGRAEPFPHSRAAWLTLAVFALTVGLWTLGKPVAQWLGIDDDFDTWVALLAIALLGASGTVKWDRVERHANWGVLLLFGGGITLSNLMESSGASTLLAETLGGALPAEPWLVYVAIAAFVVILTEFTSNTASAALLVPLFMPVAEALGASPVVAAVLVGTAASCAFMLPVATPPNALVYGSGVVPQGSMVKAGFWLSLIAVVVLPPLVPLLVLT
jgi:sodium-dependent dicarboxylate transporter 2/3/5